MAAAANAHSRGQNGDIARDAVKGKAARAKRGLDQPRFKSAGVRPSRAIRRVQKIARYLTSVRIIDETVQRFK